MLCVAVAAGVDTTTTIVGARTVEAAAAAVAVEAAIDRRRPTGAATALDVVTRTVAAIECAATAEFVTGPDFLFFYIIFLFSSAIGCTENLVPIFSDHFCG